MAAEQGFPAAQNNLGEMYASGHGVAQDYAQGFAWFARPPSRACSAQFNLG